MEDIIGVLLYNSFIELPESNQTFGKSKNSFHSLGHVKEGEKNILHNAKQARTSESLNGNLLEWKLKHMNF